VAKPLFRVIVASTSTGVRRLAQDEGWTIQGEIQGFSELDTLDDGTLGSNIGRLFVDLSGWAALASKTVGRTDE
jgi:hypothetical protein